MKVLHELRELELDLSDAISRHSADKIEVYKEVHGKPLCLGYYFPNNYVHTEKYPLFVFVHGGGWRSHKIFEDQPHWQGDHLGFLARYYADKGFICVSVDYRLIKELGQASGYGLIDNYEDCCDAIDYIMEHADEYGADVNRMYLLGESAGGHLAGALATFNYDRKYLFEKVFLFNPITDLYDPTWNSRVPVESEHSQLATLDINERTEFLSPFYQVDKSIGQIILVHGEIDTCVSLEHSRKFYEKMCKFQRPCELHIIENTTHAFLLAEYTSNMQACKIGIRIIDEHLQSVIER